MSLDVREFKIVLQNLLNRATDIEIRNSEAEGRTIDHKKIEENLSVLGKLFMSKVAAFEGGSAPSDPSKPKNSTRAS